jgi:putative hydrolase of the HAD superfamily
LTILNGIKAVFFDLDGTLRHNRPVAHCVFFDIAVSLGAPNDAKNRIHAQRWTHQYFANSPTLQEDVKLYPDEKDFWLNFTYRQLQAMNTDPELIEEIAPHVDRYMQEEYKAESWIPPEGFTTLQSLKEAEYNVGIITNRTNPIQEEMQELKLSEYVDFYYTAGEVGFWKPDPGIFSRALKLSTSQPHESVYIGDNYFADVIGARQAGIHPILFDPDNIFPDADCIVATHLEQVLDIVQGSKWNKYA